MKIIRNIKYLNLKKNSSVTIGNFDGIHLGHQNILKKMGRVAKLNNLQSIVITFEPYPYDFFNKINSFKISSFKEKYKLLESFNVDYLVVLKFNQNFAKINAHDFIKDILVNKLKTKYLLVGDDFRFGYQRQGDYDLLKSQGNKYDFKVSKMDSINSILENDPLRISSTTIRELLRKDKLELCSKLLGRNFGVYGKVIKGLGLGRELGFPTANIYIKDKKLIKLSGIFAVKVKINNNVVPGVASWGVRPTIDKNKKPLLEVYLFDYAKDLYGMELYVEFVAKIRDEQKFANLDELKLNISKDVYKAKTILGVKENSKEIIQ
tara:strand:- start:27044 stop:28006 length:963 start_codon:yes stop_codon:yes gene_type:complete